MEQAHILLLREMAWWFFVGAMFALIGIGIVIGAIVVMDRL